MWSATDEHRLSTVVVVVVESMPPGVSLITETNRWRPSPEAPHAAAENSVTYRLTTVRRGALIANTFRNHAVISLDTCGQERPQDFG